MAFDWVDWSALPIILQLVYLEGILSIDNAAVLGALVAPLPAHDPIPWPRGLQFLQKPVHRLAGGQRLAALKAGLLGAYVGRASMLFLAAWLVRTRWLLLAGGLYLIYLAVSHFAASAGEGAPGRPVATFAATFWMVVLNVELADLAFSIDNVVAAVALSREMWVILVGVFLGIVTMRFAAGIFVGLIQRQPILEAAAYLLVFVIGLEVIAEDLLRVHLSHGTKFAISLSVILGALVYARSAPLQAVGARLRWIRRVLAVVMNGLRVLLWPMRWVARVLRGRRARNDAWAGRHGGS